ncbi:hypothetical protein ACGFIX_14480 [Nocardia salmonicida]|uniref:hypothetical protein n=1 Tax=Nocardia salmonicida TaxID=53431 RepID=UPI00371803D3
MTLHLMSWTIHRVGAWGNATVTAGLFDTGTAALARPVRLNGAGGERVSSLRALTRSSKNSTVAHLEDALTVRERMRVAYNAASQILQLFGVTEPTWLTETGALRTFSLLNQRSRHAKEWAASNGVDLDGTSVPL